ncbi:MAG: serine hydrolase [Gemmatimonadaceae bacterium]
MPILAAPLQGQGQSITSRVDSIFVAYGNPASPGCALPVVDSGRTVLTKGYGMASLEHDVPITPTTAFYAASMSKQFARSTADSSPAS